MPTRFTDDLFNNTDGSDFIVRNRIPVAVQILVVFAVAFVAIYITASIMSDTGSKTLFFTTLSLCIGTLAWLTVYFSARLRDLVLATEFQNAMLASAAQLSTRFCLITKRDGSIVYVDPGFQKLFPNFMQTPERNIDGLLGGAGITQDIIRKVAVILQQNRNERVLLSLRKDTGETLPVMMSIDMLPRPKGYCLLRGRDFVENRTAEAAKPAQMTLEGPVMQALGMLPVGVLITDGIGNIVFANRAVEGWLGFEAGEMVARTLKAGQIIYQYGGMDAGRVNTADYDGEIVMQRKDRSLVKLYIRQVSLGPSAGVSAVILPPEGKSS